MPQTNLHPYLFFGGDCRDAMQFYQSIFGGDLSLSEFGDGPPNAHADAKANSPEVKKQIMHARLSGNITLMASDSPHKQRTATADSFSLSLDGTDAPLLTGYFNKLAEGGTITAPLVKQFWGDTFGMATDKFGVNWMVNITGNSAQ